LTNGEVRLASLLKIGLTNGEIASIMNITTKSLEKNRSRLRKKLGLSSSDNMEKYIQSIK
jgi:DNA-binding CsgD family transcriptional regulator